MMLSPSQTTFNVVLKSFDEAVVYMFVISHFPDQPSYRAKVIEFRDRYEIQYLELVFFM
jgi:hypothetical protein